VPGGELRAWGGVGAVLAERLEALGAESGAGGGVREVLRGGSGAFPGAEPDVEGGVGWEVRRKQ
jgi:hypothetical protein